MTDSKLPLADRLEAHHDELNCMVDFNGFKSDAEKFAEIERAMKDCWDTATLLRQQHEALKAWEAWEAEWILNGNWDHGHVLMRDADMEALTPIQQLRNQAIAAAEGEQS